MPDNFDEQVGYLIFSNPTFIALYRDEVIAATPLRYAIWHRFSPPFLEEVVSLAQRFGFQQVRMVGHEDNYADSPWFTDDFIAVTAYIEAANSNECLMDWVLADGLTGARTAGAVADE